MRKYVLFIFLILGFQLAGQSIKLQKETIYKGDFIGSVSQVALDSKGKIYVSDLTNNCIHLFFNSGKYLKHIGREGKGPGEFEDISGLQISKKDSLYVLDGKINRITVFSSGKFEHPIYTINIPGGIINNFISSVGWLNGNVINNGLWVDASNNIFVSYSETFSAGNLDKPHYLKIYKLNHLGKFADKNPLIKIKNNERLILKGGNSSFSVLRMPFGQTPIVEIGSDGYLYFANSDVFDIKAIDISGKIVRNLKYKLKPVRIKQSMWNEAIENNEYLTQKALNNSLTPLPEYKRLFDYFVVDDKGRIWVATNTADNKNYIWMIFDKNNKLITKLKFSKSVVLKIIKKGYAYGIYTDNMGFQSVIKYTIKN